MEPTLSIERTDSAMLRVALALTSLAAAAIHFSVTADHFDEHLAIGLFFLVVSWGQAFWAASILVVNGRRAILGGLAGNLMVILVWGISRTIGVPIGPDPWSAEAVGAADLTATALEIGIVVGCGLLVTGRAIPLSRIFRGRVAVPALGLALAVLSGTVIVTDPGHTHAGAGGDDHHGTSAEASGEHSHRLVGSGEADLAQIELVRSAMKKYRDVDTAFADGWKSEHDDWPEIGSHFYRGGDWAGPFPNRPEVDINDPEFLMYSKLLTGKWKLVAVAYVVDQALYPEPPNELKGAIYHEHVWNCIDNGEELEQEDWGVISKEECKIMGGEWNPGGVWMTHVWLIDNPSGIFAETNPALV
jgi:hypothetical protein